MGFPTRERMMGEWGARIPFIRSPSTLHSQRVGKPALSHSFASPTRNPDNSQLTISKSIPSSKSQFPNPFGMLIRLEWVSDLLWCLGVPRLLGASNPNSRAMPYHSSRLKFGSWNLKVIWKLETEISRNHHGTLGTIREHQNCLQ